MARKATAGASATCAGDVAGAGVGVWWDEMPVDGRIPAPVDESFIPLFIFVYKVSTIQGGAGFLPSTVCCYPYDVYC